MTKPSNLPSTESSAKSEHEIDTTLPLVPRGQLNDSQREASRTHPENYQEEAVEHKIVSTERARQTDVGSVHGLDNKPDKPGIPDPASKVK